MANHSTVHLDPVKDNELELNVMQVVPPSENGDAKTERAELTPKSHAAAAQAEEEEEGKEAPLLLLVLLCLAASLEGADQMMLPSTSKALQQDLGLGIQDISTMTLAQALTNAAAAPFWGVLADRGIIRRKTILMIGCVLQGVITMLLAAVTAFSPMCALRALNGAMLASLRPVSNGIVADVTSESRRGKAFGKVQMSLMFGQCVGSLTAAPLSTMNINGMEGWRVAFLGIGAIAVMIGVFIFAFMKEPKREVSDAERTASKGMFSEVYRLVHLLSMPTFCSLVLQGCFGCVPWNALGYQTLFYQVNGLKDWQAGFLQAMSQISGAAGNLLGGTIGDAFARRCRIHGRPFAAQISVFSGIPIAWCIFMVQPPPFEPFWWYLILVVMLGLWATWCATGVNWPILSEIVSPDGRSAILAWQTALEGSSAAVFGNAAVGYLATAFGYKNLNSSGESMDVESARALGKALTFTSFGPWIICLVFYTLLHWSYPRDLRRVMRERDEREARIKALKKEAEAEGETCESRKSSRSRATRHRDATAVDASPVAEVAITI